MIPPESYDINLDDSELMISIGINSKGDVVYQLHDRDRDLVDEVHIGDVFMIMNAMNIIVEEMLYGIIENTHAAEETPDTNSFRVDEELE